MAKRRSSKSSSHRPRVTDNARDPVTSYARRVVARRIVAGRLVRLACERHLRDLKREGDKDFPYHFDATRVQDCVRFFDHFLTLDDERPFALLPWLAFVFGSLEGWVDASGEQRFQTAYVETGKGTGKALALDTPIATPTGWSTMGALRSGDHIFADDGSVCTVVKAHDVMIGHACYRVAFDDGTSIVADAEHLWQTEQRTFGSAYGASTRGVKRDERGRWRIGLRTTEQIAKTLRYANGKYQSANHSIPLCGALDLPSLDLTIEPYLLGVWLGDGDSDAGRITMGSQSRDEQCRLLREAGARLGTPKPTKLAWRVRVDGLQSELRQLDLLKNKHIPRAYFRGSIAQRLALLQGLMDTDGTIDRRNGICTFTSTRFELAEGVQSLAVSLGLKATVTAGRATIKDRDCGPVWDVAFSAPESMRVFRLSTKNAHQFARHTRRRLSGERRIVSCDPVLSVPVRCIAVDSPSHLFLAGRGLVPTHNTPAAAGYGLYALVGKAERSAEIYSLGVDAGQASYLFKFAKRMAERSDELRAVLDIGEHNIAWLANENFFRPLSAEGRSLDNKRPYLALVDELHEHPSAVIPEKMRLGFKGRRDALLFEITNAGFDKTSVCWEHHDYSVKILERAITGNAAERWFAYVCQLDACDACRDQGMTQPVEGCARCDAWTDPAVWPKVNPSLGVTMTSAQMASVVAEALDRPASQARVKRLYFCLWTQAHTIWIPMEHWDACRANVHEDAGGRACSAGFDMSMKLDLTACAIALRVDDAPNVAPVVIELSENIDGEPVTKTLNLNFSVELTTFFWLPEDTLRERVKNEHVPLDVWRDRGHLRVTPGAVIDYDQIYDEFTKQIAPPFRPQRVGYDPHNASQFALQLRDKAKFTVADVKQGRALSESFKLFEALVRSRRLRHNGNLVMGWCVSNAEPKLDRYENLWLEKPSPTKRIDGVIAAVIALNQLVLLPAHRPKRRRPMLFTPGGFTPLGDPKGSDLNVRT